MQNKKGLRFIEKGILALKYLAIDAWCPLFEYDEKMMFSYLAS